MDRGEHEEEKRKTIASFVQEINLMIGLKKILQKNFLMAYVIVFVSW